MDDLYKKEEHRRATRKEILADTDFQRIEAQVLRRSDLNRPEIKAYLYSANVEITELDDSHLLQGRVAFFPESAFVHLEAPLMALTWNRHRHLLDRAAIVIVRRGRLEIVSEAPILRRDPRAYLIGPHHLPATIRVLEPFSEFIIMSIPSRHVHTVIPDYETAARAITSPLPDTLLLPMCSFAIGICTLSVNEVSDAAPLTSASEEIIRSTLRLLVSTKESNEPSLYSLAVRLILNEYSDPSLDVAALARRLQVSTRKLQAVFKEEGTTISSTLREVRAAAARKLKREQPRLVRARFAEFAGFGSVDALDRAMREFG